jgi:hypothetical protein
MVGSHHVWFGGRHTSFFIAKNTLVFTLFVQRVFSFSATAFSFCFSPWFLFRSCYIFASRFIWTSGLSKDLSQKGFWMVLEKRKSFMQKSGTKMSLFRLRLRLLHAMLDIVLIVCLVIFAVAWLVSNDWDCLMSLWKIMRCFYYLEALIWFSPLMLYLGWLGTCLHMLTTK